MTWFKVDDKLWSHPKWLATPAASRGLWVTAGSWSAHHELDGFVPTPSLRLLGHTKTQAAALVAAGLWAVVDGGWEFHGWAEFQPTKAELQAKREAKAEAGRAGGRASGRSRREASASSDASPEGEANANPVPSPSRTRPVASNEATSRGARETKIPTDWEPTPEHRTRAAEDSLDADREAIKFRAHADEKGRTAKNWNAAFTRWLINAAEYAQRDTARGTRSTDRQGDLLQEEMARARAADAARAGQLQIDGAR